MQADSLITLIAAKVTSLSETAKQKGEKVMEVAKEKYFAPYKMVEVTSRQDGIVAFKLYVGYSCPLKMSMEEERFKRWLDEKQFKAA